MKSLTIKQLDEKDEEIVDDLISLGMSRPIARILSYLKNVRACLKIHFMLLTVEYEPIV